jgi:hypothetical protein
MTAPGTGSPPEVSTRPSTYMYSPFPSDAIDSPSKTVDATKKRAMRDGEDGNHGPDRVLTVWRVLSEEGAQDAALRRVPGWGVVERVDESGDAEHV